MRMRTLISMRKKTILIVRMRTIYLYYYWKKILKMMKTNFLNWMKIVIVNYWNWILRMTTKMRKVIMNLTNSILTVSWKKKRILTKTRRMTVKNYYWTMKILKMRMRTLIDCLMKMNFLSWMRTLIDCYWNWIVTDSKKTRILRTRMRKG